MDGFACLAVTHRLGARLSVVHITGPDYYRGFGDDSGQLRDVMSNLTQQDPLGLR